jgi:hypothetical protein
LTVGEQLAAGARYLDIRVAWDDEAKVYDVVHGPVKGPLLETVLDDLTNFLKLDRKDIVLVHFAPQNLHKYNKLAEFASLISKRFGSWLYRPADTVAPVSSSPIQSSTDPFPHKQSLEQKREILQKWEEPDLLTKRGRHHSQTLPCWDTLRDITANGPMLVALYKDVFATPQTRLCKESWVVGRWINTSSVATKLTGLAKQFDQLSKKPPTFLFNVQWTLTPQPEDTVKGFFSAVNPSAPTSVEHLAHRVNCEISPFLAGLRMSEIRQISIFSVDFMETVDVNGLTRALNRFKSESSRPANRPEICERGEATPAAAC